MKLNMTATPCVTTHGSALISPISIRKRLSVFDVAVGGNGVTG